MQLLENQLRQQSLQKAVKTLIGYMNIRYTYLKYVLCIHNKRKREISDSPEAEFYFKTRKIPGIILKLAY